MISCFGRSPCIHECSIYKIELIAHTFGYGPACYIYTKDYKITTPADNHRVWLLSGLYYMGEI
jgi:hypothetical protein